MNMMKMIGNFPFLSPHLRWIGALVNAEPADGPRDRRPIVIGVAVAGVFLGGFGIWAAVAPLSSAAVSMGEVRVESHRKTVQHMEGGIIREILVHEGETVQAGQLLVRFDDTQAASALAVLRTEYDGLKTQESSVERQIDVVNQEIEGVAPLVKAQLLLRTRLLELQQQIASLDGQRGKLLADFAGVTEKMRAAAEVQQRTDLRAPQSGKIVNLRYFTPGGVVKPGDPVLDIVPQDDNLVIESQVRPLDIESVHAGLPAEIRLIAYNQLNTPIVYGTVSYVSADTLIDERTGQSHYVADVELDLQALGRLKNVKLYPGMPAEVLIITGERTMLAYLLDPIRNSFSRAFREM
jgi:multidrug efflux pump subunit AcrA (membrane-fusion protein)